MRVINLTHGAGNGVDKACLITASNMLIGRGEDLDVNTCVCPLLREFIIITNDKMPLPLLRELYTPLIWEILGTRNDDIEVLQKRAFCFADWAVRDICKIKCDPIVDIESTKAAADSAANAAYAANAAIAAARAAVSASTGVWKKCPEIIRKVAAIGDKRPVETVMGEEKLRCLLSV